MVHSAVLLYLECVCMYVWERYLTTFNPIFGFQMVHKRASEVKVSPSFSPHHSPLAPASPAGRWVMLILRSGGVEWQMTEGLIQRETKGAVTAESVAVGGNGKQRQRSGTSIGRREAVSDQAYWYASEVMPVSLSFYSSSCIYHFHPHFCHFSASGALNTAQALFLTLTNARSTLCF